mgnify:CR=1 FL=1
MSESVYVSKIDTWLLILLVATVAIALVAAGATIVTKSLVAILTGAFIAVLGAGLPVWLLTSTKYTIGSESLFVQSGPFHWKIPLSEISSVEPSRNPLSSPALSLDRLHIKYGRGQAVLISPEPRERFIEELEQARDNAA